MLFCLWLIFSLLFSLWFWFCFVDLVVVCVCDWLGALLEVLFDAGFTGVILIVGLVGWLLWFVVHFEFGVLAGVYLIVRLR